MRPDESVAQGEIKRAKERTSEIEAPLHVAKNVASAFVGGGTALAGAKIYSKIAPFLNKYIPADLAFKGINKVAPKLGTFLKNGLQQGLNLQEGLDYLMDSLGPKEKAPEGQQEPAKEGRNIIQQYSPELFQFIEQEVGKGRSPIEAGALAQNDKKFADIIKKMMKDHKTPWSSIVEGIFGANPEVKRRETLGKFKEQTKQTGQEREKERFNKYYGPEAEEVMNPPHSQPTGAPSAELQAATQGGVHPGSFRGKQAQQPQQPGQGQQALMSILQKLQQSRGGQ